MGRRETCRKLWPPGNSKPSPALDCSLRIHASCIARPLLKDCTERFGAHSGGVQVALVRLCYGDDSLEMVQAMTDLAEGYAKEGLWPQVKGIYGTR